MKMLQRWSRRGTGNAPGFLRLALFAVAFVSILAGSLPFQGGAPAFASGQSSGPSADTSDILAQSRASHRGLPAEFHRKISDTHRLHAGGTAGIVPERSDTLAYAVPRQIAFSPVQSPSQSVPRAFDPRAPPSA
jgi:hypothetical protein